MTRPSVVEELPRRLRKLADHMGYLLTDPPQKTENRSLIEQAADAIEALRNERDEARHEASCCDDIKIDQPLAGIISDLQADREMWRFAAKHQTQLKAVAQDMAAERLARATAAESQVAELREALGEVMEWIGNWSPNFSDDDEWPATQDRARRALSTKE